MELKLDRISQRKRINDTFNRTTMELKRNSLLSVYFREPPFNRTTMELKQAFGDRMQGIGTRFESTIEHHQTHLETLKHLAADRIYHTNKNRTICTQRNIHHNFTPMIKLLDWRVHSEISRIIT